MSNATLANAALMLSSKMEKYSRWGPASKNKSKKPWALCRRAECNLFFAGAPTIGNKIESKGKSVTMSVIGGFSVGYRYRL